MIMSGTVLVGLVLTVCNIETEECNVYIPATYEATSMVQGKEECRKDFKRLVNKEIESGKYFVPEAECKVIEE